MYITYAIPTLDRDYALSLGIYMSPKGERKNAALYKVIPWKMIPYALLLLFILLFDPFSAALTTLHKPHMLPIARTLGHQPLDLVADTQNPVIPLGATPRLENHTAACDTKLADSCEFRALAGIAVGAVTIASTSTASTRSLLLRILDIISVL